MSKAQACCGSSSILKRLITRYPENVFPQWCQADVRATLRAFCVSGRVGSRRSPSDATRTECTVIRFAASE